VASRWRRTPRTDVAEYARPVMASAAVASGDKPDEEATARAGLVRQQQQRVWNYRPEVPELGHAILFYENCFSRIRLTVAIEEDDGTRIPAIDEDGKEVRPGAKEAIAAVRDLRSRIGGQSALMRAIGGCLGSVGEGHLVGMDDDRMKSKKGWSFLSPSEFYEPTNAAQASSPNGTQRERTYEWLKTPGTQPTKVKASEAVVARIWKPDRQFSLLPWAPAMGMLDIFEELVLLTREVAGAAKSRLALAGLLLVADDIEYASADDSEKSDTDDEEDDPFVADLIRTASTAIRDKTSAAGVVPLVMRVPFDRVENGVKLIEFGRKFNEQAAADRAECVTRFAQGINLPVEVVKGHMSTTFANAAQISADMYRLYIEPEVLIGTDGLTVAYLQTLLPGTEFVIHPDPTDLIVKPDQIGDWKDAHDRFVVSDASYREKLGVGDKAKPDDEEIARRMLIKAAGRASALQDAQASTDPNLNAGEAAATGPAQPTPIAAALEVEVRRVMQRVGARLRSKVSGNRGLATLIASVPDAEVAATLGATQVERLMSEAELLGREFDVLHAWVCEHADRIVADQVREQARNEAARRMFLPVGR
jgi:hypothetical protein